MRFFSCHKFLELSYLIELFCFVKSSLISRSWLSIWILMLAMSSRSLFSSFAMIFCSSRSVKIFLIFFMMLLDIFEYFCSLASSCSLIVIFLNDRLLIASSSKLLVVEKFLKFWFGLKVKISLARLGLMMIFPFGIVPGKRLMKPRSQGPTRDFILEFRLKIIFS